MSEPRTSLRGELAAVVACAAVAMLSLPLVFAPLGLSWDGLNHHVYLGWMAEANRLDRDFLAAGFQSLTYPYLYWPVYRLAASGAGPQLAGATLAALNVLAVPPVWMVARACMPGATLGDAALRGLAVLLAFMSGVVLSMFDTTANDLLAAIPLVWSIAFAMDTFRRGGPRTVRANVLLSGALAGLAVAFKLSNGPIAVLLPLLWMCAPGATRQRAVNVMLSGAATLAGFVIAYGYWGAQLWMRFGNPLYPYYDSVFAPVRAWAGWAP